MSEDRYISATVDNQTDHSLRLKNSRISCGKWLIEPQDIPARSKINPAFHALGEFSTSRGTEGKVLYALGDSGATVTITWNVSDSGANSFSIDSSAKDDYEGVDDGSRYSSCDGCLVTFIIRDK